MTPKQKAELLKDRVEGLCLAQRMMQLEKGVRKVVYYPMNFTFYWPKLTTAKLLGPFEMENEE